MALVACFHLRCVLTRSEGRCTAFATLAPLADDGSSWSSRSRGNGSSATCVSAPKPRGCRIQLFAILRNQLELAPMLMKLGPPFGGVGADPVVAHGAVQPCVQNGWKACRGSIHTTQTAGTAGPSSRGSRQSVAAAAARACTQHRRRGESASNLADRDYSGSVCILRVNLRKEYFAGSDEKLSSHRHWSRNRQRSLSNLTNHIKFSNFGRR
eukprot:6203685-Pleurochrysis_carterae.AAC.4